MPIRLIAMCRECQDNSNITQKYSCILTFTPRPSLNLYFSSKQVTPVIAKEGKSSSSYNKRSSLRRSGRLSGATTPASSPLSVSLSRQLTTEAADSTSHNKSVNEVEIERDTDYTEVSGNWLIYYLIYWVWLISRLIDWSIDWLIDCSIGQLIDWLMLNWAAKRFLQGWNVTSSIDDNNNNLVMSPVEVRWLVLFLLSLLVAFMW